MTYIKNIQLGVICTILLWHGTAMIDFACITAAGDIGVNDIFHVVQLVNHLTAICKSLSRYGLHGHCVISWHH
jgi:hypothetical protein